MDPSKRRSVLVAAVAFAAVALAYKKLASDDDDDGSASVDLRRPRDINARTAETLARFLGTHSMLKGYVDSPWLRFGGEFMGSVQTVGHYFARQLHPTSPANAVSYTRELLVLSDGGTVALDWAKSNSTGASRRPLVLIHHGLCGSSQSVYVTHLVHALHSRGYDSVVLVARGCGGLALSTSEGFTAARTADMRQALQHISTSTSTSKHADVYAVGFSLGAGLLLKYLGEEREAAGLRGAVCISPSFDFSRTPAHFAMWSKYRLVGGLVAWAKQHAHVLQRHPLIQWDAVLSAGNVREFDEACVVRAYGYRDVDHYYEDASPVRVTAGVHVPTLALCALDDPVCCGRSVPASGRPELGPGLVAVVTQRGGHVAFAEGWFPHESWMDRACLDWLDSTRQE